MKIYFSGWAHEDTAAGLERRPSFMLTYYDLEKRMPSVLRLLKRYLKRKNGQKRK